jgi:hypothetical protein
MIGCHFVTGSNPGNNNFRLNSLYSYCDTAADQISEIVHTVVHAGVLPASFRVRPSERSRYGR